MSPFKGRVPPCPSMKYKFSEPLFASSVKWGYSILPDYGDSQRRQRVSQPTADCTLLLDAGTDLHLWGLCFLHVPGVPKGPRLTLITSPEVLPHLLCTQSSAQEKVKTLSPPHHPEPTENWL